MDGEEVTARDVGWAVADGVTKPIREVIAERKTEAAKIPLAIRNVAYRDRCRLQAMLLQCLCDFPIVMCDETESKHRPWCPAEGQLQSFKRIDGR